MFPHARLASKCCGAILRRLFASSPAENGATDALGLIPYWWEKPLKQLPASFNARAESVADKPMFRDAFQASSMHHPSERLL